MVYEEKMGEGVTNHPLEIYLLVVSITYYALTVTTMIEYLSAEHNRHNP